MIDVVKSAYDMVDLFTVVRTLEKVGYSSVVAESIFG